VSSNPSGLPPRDRVDAGPPGGQPPGWPRSPADRPRGRTVALYTRRGQGSHSRAAGPRSADGGHRLSDPGWRSGCCGPCGPRRCELEWSARFCWSVAPGPASRGCPGGCPRPCPTCPTGGSLPRRFDFPDKSTTAAAYRVLAPWDRGYAPYSGRRRSRCHTPAAFGSRDGQVVDGGTASVVSRTIRCAGRCVRRAEDRDTNATRCSGLKRACARRSLGKEERCRKQLKTFRRNPVGHRAHPVESGQQPEASLASWQVTARAKRRQPVSRAGPFSPEIRSHRGSLCRARRWGPRRLSCTGLGGRSRRGLEKSARPPWGSPGTWEACLFPPFLSAARVSRSQMYPGPAVASEPPRERTHRWRTAVGPLRTQ
jgi:hypothetical protein